MDEAKLDELLARLQRLEDEAAITRVILSYGPAADAGLTNFAANVWSEDGVYDWNDGDPPHEGRQAIDTRLQGPLHQKLIGNGSAHFTGPLMIEVDGDTAVALGYSMAIKRGEDQYLLFRVSAARFDLERTGSSWRVTRRTNRLLDDSRVGQQLFATSLHELFGETPK